jgi:hypothetical protein
MNDDPQSPLPSSAHEAKLWIAGLAEQLSAKGIVLREPPEEPTSCCGRGCNGCVWEGYMSAVGYWCEQARDALLAQP